MALKDWKKDGKGSYISVDKIKGNRFLSIVLDSWTKEYRIDYLKERNQEGRGYSERTLKSFKTRLEALKYIKNYMRKH